MPNWVPQSPTWLSPIDAMAERSGACGTRRRRSRSSGCGRRASAWRRWAPSNRSRTSGAERPARCPVAGRRPPRRAARRATRRLIRRLMKPGPAISGGSQRSLTSSRATISAATSRGGPTEPLRQRHGEICLVIAELRVLAAADHVEQLVDTRPSRRRVPRESAAGVQ